MAVGKNKGKQAAKGKGQSGKQAAARRKSENANKPLIMGITKNDIKRLARKGGVKRIRNDVYDFTRDIIHSFLGMLVRDSMIYMQAAKRVTCYPMDVVMAMKRQGVSLYGIQMK